MPVRSPAARRLHRSTLAVLLLSVLGTAAGTLLTQHLVQQSERRLLQQKAGAAALIMSGLLAQSFTPAVQALATTVRPDGAVDPTSFAMVSRSLSRPEPTTATGQGGLGASAAAVLDLTAGTVVRSSGTLVLSLDDPAQRAGLVRAAASAAGDPSHAAFAGLHRTAQGKALGMLALAPAGRVGYLEMPFTDAVQVGSLAAAPQYDLAFGGLDFAVAYGDPDGAELLWTNVRSGRLDGYASRVYVGMTSSSGFEGTSYDPVRRPLMIALAARQPLTGQFAHVFPWLLLAFGTVSGLSVMVLTEKTQRRKDDALALVGQLEARNADVEDAVRRRERAEDQLRQSQRLEAIGQLAGGVAHDFNNLLAVIFSYLGFLRVEGQGQPWLEDVDEVDKAAHRAAELTQQLLLFSRREAPQADVVDLVALVADRHRLLQRTLSDDIEVVLDLPSDRLCVLADATELDQVVMNLAVNARDAMPDGGTLTFRVRAGDGPAAQVELTVHDTGVGMSSETREHAFEPFFTTKEVGRGTGLGLATVYGIVTRCGGTVSICSEPGAGTTITVLLPQSACTPAGAAGGDVATGRVAHAHRVLLVEDEHSVRRASARILSEAGFEVLEASSGPEALQVFEREPIDVLVSDVVMPGGMSGADLADRLRHDRPGLPVVLTSGYSRDHLTRRGPLPLGTTLVPKPFSASTLVEAVRRSVDTEGALA